MNVKARIRFKAKKMLGPMLSYSSFDSSALPDNLASFLSTNEKAIGVYKNSDSSYILITIKGMHIIDGLDDQFVAFRDIREATIPCKIKTEANILELKLRNGVTRFLPVRNGKGRFRDIYEFYRFVRHGIELTAIR